MNATAALPVVGGSIRNDRFLANWAAPLTVCKWPISARRCEGRFASVCHPAPLASFEIRHSWLEDLRAAAQDVQRGSGTWDGRNLAVCMPALSPPPTSTRPLGPTHFGQGVPKNAPTYLQVQGVPKW